MPTQATLTLRDVADLAGVRRPVVSAWRQRTRVRSESVSFPPPVTTRGGVAHFDREEVVDYLRRTQRGNNPEFALDAPATAMLPDADADDLLTLLCLRVVGGTELADRSAAELRDLATEVDPGDVSLTSEVARIAPDAGDLCRLVDEVVEATYGGGDALDHVLGGRLRREAGTRELTREGLGVLERVSSALVDVLGPDKVMLSDASSGRSDLVLRMVATRDEQSSGIVVPGRHAAARRLRRLSLLRGLVPVDRAEAPAVAVVDALGLGPVATLDLIDRVQLDLPEHSLAVAVGSAESLCDGTRDVEATAIRDGILRTGRLRAAFRLPRGLWQDAHRQALGLWVLGGPSPRPIDQRRIALADLGQRRVRDLDLHDLAVDAVAALSEDDHHAFRYARRLPTARVLASTAVVPRGMGPAPIPSFDSATSVLAIERLLGRLGEAVPAYAVSPRPTGSGRRPDVTTLGELRSRGLLVLRRGSRLDPRHASAEGTVRALDPAGGPELAFDPLDLERHHPRATRTEPGDVVFTDKPPAAVVDEVGGRLVAYPARALRLPPGAALGPHTLASIVNRQPDSAREWTAWPAPDLEPAQADALETEMMRLAQISGDLRRRVAVVTELSHALLDAAASRAVLLPDPTDASAAASDHEGA